MLDLILIRVLFVAIMGLAAFYLRPLGLPPFAEVAIGVAAGCAVIIFEIRIKQVSLKRLIGAAFGSLLGILGAYLISLVLEEALPNNQNMVPFLQVVLLAFMTYCGLAVGAAKGDLLNLAALGGLFGGDRPTRNTFKIL